MRSIVSNSNIKKQQIIKETKYCKIKSQGKVGEGEYTYSIEKIYIKELKRDEEGFVSTNLQEEVMKHTFQEVLM